MRIVIEENDSERASGHRVLMSIQEYGEDDCMQSVVDALVNCEVLALCVYAEDGSLHRVACGYIESFTRDPDLC